MPFCCIATNARGLFSDPSVRYGAAMPIRATLTLCAIAVCLLAVGVAQAARPWWMRGIESNQTDFLPPDTAFRVGAVVDGKSILVRWVIADGYYLYRQKIEVRAESPDLVVSAPALPSGAVKTDQFLGTQEIYTQQLEARVAFARFDAGAHPLQIKVTYQGCAEAGLCYPPMTKVLFPRPGEQAALPARPSGASPLAWELVAMIGGLLAFLLSGFALRRQRRLEPPPQ
jgi:thiol:disulfide interchange protein DsbD